MPHTLHPRPDSMRVLWRTLLLSHALCCLVISGAGAQRQWVTQHPLSLEVWEGDTVELNCTFHSSDGQMLAVVKYLKWPDLLSVSEASPTFQGRVVKQETEKDQHANTKTVSLRIQDLSTCDSGRYICEVHFFTGQTLNGTGTTLKVNRLQEGQKLDILQTALQITRIVLLMLLVCMAFFLIVKQKKQK